VRLRADPLYILEHQHHYKAYLRLIERKHTTLLHGCRVLYCGGYGGLRRSGSVEMVFANGQRQ
jgi:hypothetical protein